MAKFNENYYSRACFFEKEQVPTQSVMIKTMSPPLAAVYFKSMTPKLKVLAGLEPPMKGGGSDWFVPPKDLLEGRAVLKPLKKEFLSKLNYLGIDTFGMHLVEVHRRRMEDEKNRAILESDNDWKNSIEMQCQQEWVNASRRAARLNTERILYAFNEFTNIYSSSINKIEKLLYDASEKDIKRAQKETFEKMSKLYETKLKQQAGALYDKYTEKLMNEKAKLKALFIQNIEKTRSLMADNIHDINVEKHVAIEKLRQYLNCQNLACQVYVALKEREECSKEIALSKHIHQKKVKALTEEIALKDFEILLATEKERKRQEFNKIWQKKVCHIVKKFQLFVSYCLNATPEHAEFFLNMEKLMMLQLNEALPNPSAESIFVFESEKFHTPIPKPHPFYLFCDRGTKANVDQNLCPKHCTSSASQMPAIIINKHCIYAACDNFEMFTDKITEYLHGKHGNDHDFIDDHIYEYDVPVKYSYSMELKGLKLESSLLQILQQEMPNIKAVSTECCICRIPHCFCSPLHASNMSLPPYKAPKVIPPAPAMSPGNKIESRSIELIHEREPKWESYMKYVEPSKCNCPKKAKKHLAEHIPPYMRNTSRFEAPELPNYERCSLTTLKRLVRKAKGIVPTPPPPEKVPSRTKDVSTQYSDQEFELLCTCFSEEEIALLFEDLMKGSKLFDASRTAPQFKVVGGSTHSTHLTQQPSSFATDRAFSLRNLIDDSSELEEIFKRKDCSVD